MNYIILKLSAVFLLIYDVHQIHCKVNHLEDKYEIGKEILLSISIYHDNITKYFTIIDKEYDNLWNIFKDKNNTNIDNFIVLSKKHVVLEINNLAQHLNNLSLNEQLKYEEFIRSNANTFKEKIPLFNNCFKNNTLLNKALRCIDEQQNLKSNNINKAENDFYENIKKLLDQYNTILISKIKGTEKLLITAINEIISFAKNYNDKVIKRSSSISISSISSTNKNNKSLINSVSESTYYNDTLLRDLYVDQKNNLNEANFLNWIIIQSMSLNVTFNYISNINTIYFHDKKKHQCCLERLKNTLEKEKNIAINITDECLENKMLELENIVSLQNKKVKKMFPTCFSNYDRLEDIFKCMGQHQSFSNAPKNLKLSYKEAVDKFISNEKLLSAQILNCSYQLKDYFNQRLNNLNNQFDICIKNEKPHEECNELSIHNLNS